MLMVLALVASGCATAPHWSYVGSGRAMPESDQGFAVLAPVGWVAIEGKAGVLFTRDGPDIQLIQVAKAAHGEAFPLTKQSSSAEMRPHQLAELMIAEIKAESPSVEVVANRPTIIGTQEGFFLHLRFKNAKGLEYQVALYGFADHSGFYTLKYRAPSLHFFARDLQPFTDVLGSFRRTS